MRAGIAAAVLAACLAFSAGPGCAADTRDAPRDAERIARALDDISRRLEALETGKGGGDATDAQLRELKQELSRIREDVSRLVRPGDAAGGSGRPGDQELERTARRLALETVQKLLELSRRVLERAERETAGALDAAREPKP